MDITKNNFGEQLDNITKDLQRSCFIGFDAEFTAILSGEGFKHRLFDTNEERYDKMKNEVSKMIMTQIGLSMFQYERDIDTYVAVTYTFHLCPQTFGDIDQSFIFQASTLKFLCRHNFDFNKFTYQGLSYLSKAEEAIVRQHLKDNTLFQNLSCGLEIDDEKLVQSYNSEVSKWLSSSDEPTVYIDVKNPILRYITHHEIRNRFPGVLTTDSLGNSNKVLIYRNKNVKGANSAPKAILEENLMKNLLGFSQIISLLATYKKPIVGHNSFLDIVLLHSQFIGPLPQKYATFKENIHELFPILYDTKYISHDMGKKLTFDEVWRSNTLQDLYEFFSEGKCKKLELGVNPIRLSTPFDDKQTYHEAGWDSFCSGYCLIRMGHWAACELSGTYRPVGPTQKLAALAPYCNKINVIRGALPYVNFVGDDPSSHRPNLLHVKTLKERVINVSSMASAFTCFGSIDIKPYGSRAALIAANSQHTLDMIETFNHILDDPQSWDVDSISMSESQRKQSTKPIADKIVKQFKNSREYRVSEFSPYRHGAAARVALWGGAFLTGSLVLYFFHNNIKSKSTLL